MPLRRRSILRLLALWPLAGSWKTLAAPAPRFVTVPVDAAAFSRALAAETGTPPRDGSDRIFLEVPQVAEDGAIVPLTVETSLPDVTELVILAERNPTPVVARFTFDRALDPFVSLRIKLNESGDVIALVKTAETAYVVRERVQVVVGGCG